MRSLKDWNEHGRWIKKGEHAVAFSTDGIALFTIEQTYLPGATFQEEYGMASGGGEIMEMVGDLSQW